nr:uncharacterized protein LOC129283810 [Lytechinus pictus]
MDELYERFKVVTAISENHFEEVKPWIGSIQEFMPGQEIILYNLGLSKTSLEKVRVLCDVQVREFPFSSYPNHVRDLHTYAWKPIIIDVSAQFSTNTLINKGSNLNHRGRYNECNFAHLCTFKGTI